MLFCQLLHLKKNLAMNLSRRFVAESLRGSGIVGRSWLVMNGQ
jgi:hypothetical protein